MEAIRDAQLELRKRTRAGGLGVLYKAEGINEEIKGESREFPKAADYSRGYCMIVHQRSANKVLCNTVVDGGYYQSGE